jgi:hypothetical protein
MSIQNLRTKLVEIFETYSAAIEDSPNARWLRVAQQHGIENIQTVKFVPYAVVDDNMKPMTSKQDLGRFSTKESYYGYSTEDEVRKAVERLKKISSI